MVFPNHFLSGMCRTPTVGALPCGEWWCNTGPECDMRQRKKVHIKMIRADQTVRIKTPN